MAYITRAESRKNREYSKEIHLSWRSYLTLGSAISIWEKIKLVLYATGEWTSEIFYETEEEEEEEWTEIYLNWEKW